MGLDILADSPVGSPADIHCCSYRSTADSAQWWWPPGCSLKHYHYTACRSSARAHTLHSKETRWTKWSTSLFRKSLHSTHSCTQNQCWSHSKIDTHREWLPLDRHSCCSLTSLFDRHGLCRALGRRNLQLRRPGHRWYILLGSSTASFSSYSCWTLSNDSGCVRRALDLIVKVNTQYIINQQKWFKSQDIHEACYL